MNGTLHMLSLHVTACPTLIGVFDKSHRQFSSLPVWMHVLCIFDLGNDNCFHCVIVLIKTEFLSFLSLAVHLVMLA